MRQKENNWNFLWGKKCVFIGKCQNWSIRRYLINFFYKKRIFFYQNKKKKNLQNSLAKNLVIEYYDVEPYIIELEQSLTKQEADNTQKQNFVYQPWNGSEVREVSWLQVIETWYALQCIYSFLLKYGKLYYFMSSKLFFLQT